ncbi:hypothetical protein ACFQVC_17820 [Streptomyces monticola]|uniref:Uncharacterized protein n=1 Tax=Streptomyces monticola TaxID=2666263 RepID=A0ABW2JIY5_9ACTN
MSSHIEHYYEPGCHLCNAQTHAEAEAEAAKEAAKQAAVDASSNGPLALWGCLFVLAVLLVGSAIPIALWRLP